MFYWDLFGVRGKRLHKLHCRHFTGSNRSLQLFKLCGWELFVVRLKQLHELSRRLISGRLSFPELQFMCRGHFCREQWLHDIIELLELCCRNLLSARDEHVQ